MQGRCSCVPRLPLCALPCWPSLHTTALSQPTAAPRRCGFTNWTTTALGCDDFYTDPNAIQLYKNYVRTVLQRVNSVTGVPYASDPTIMGALLAQ